MTKRQEKALLMIADGASNKDIAQEFNLGMDTVKHILSELYRELGAKNRANAVALAYHKGVLIVP